jgi:methionyl aminopeptidase
MTKVAIMNEFDIAKMRVAGKIAAEVLDYIEPFVQPGVTTNELNNLCHDYIVNVHGAFPAPLNCPNPDPAGPPFPKSICASVNDIVCHGIPNDKPLKNGDIVNLDVMIGKDGYFGDTSRMFYVGEIDKYAERLCKITLECLWKAIYTVKPGSYLGDIGAIIQAHAESNGYSVVREFGGHGIGKKFHAAPEVLHYGQAKTGLRLEPGMIFTIEPMINQGRKEIRFASDGWTALTKDRKLSAQWEHTILVTDNGYEVLSISPNMPLP